MSGQTEQLKQKLEEMLASNNPEWADAVKVTLNAMYKQFQQEQKHGKEVIPVRSRRISQPQIALSCGWGAHDRLGLSVPLVVVLLILTSN